MPVAGSLLGVCASSKATVPAAAARRPLWYDASDASTLFQDAACTQPVTADGQKVRGWKNKGGLPMAVTLTNDTGNCLYRPTGLGGLPFVQLNNSSLSNSTVNGPAVFDAAHNLGFTMVAVFASDGWQDFVTQPFGPGSSFIAADGNGSIREQFGGSSSTFSVYTGPNVSPAYLGDAASGCVYIVVTSRSGTPSTKLYAFRRSNLLATSSVAQTEFFDRTGPWGIGSPQWNPYNVARVAEVRIYRVALSDAELDAEFDELRVKWRLPVVGNVPDADGWNADVGSTLKRADGQSTGYSASVGLVTWVTVDGARSMSTQNSQGLPITGMYGGYGGVYLAAAQTLTYTLPSSTDPLFLFDSWVVLVLQFPAAATTSRSMSLNFTGGGTQTMEMILGFNGGNNRVEASLFAVGTGTVGTIDCGPLPTGSGQVFAVAMRWTAGASGGLTVRYIASNQQSVSALDFPSAPVAPVASQSHTELLTVGNSYKLSLERPLVVHFVSRWQIGDSAMSNRFLSLIHYFKIV